MASEKRIVSSRRASAMPGIVSEQYTIGRQSPGAVDAGSAVFRGIGRAFRAAAGDGKALNHGILVEIYGAHGARSNTVFTGTRHSFDRCFISSGTDKHYTAYNRHPVGSAVGKKNSAAIVHSGRRMNRIARGQGGDVHRSLKSQLGTRLRLSARPRRGRPVVIVACKRRIGIHIVGPRRKRKMRQRQNQCRNHPEATGRKQCFSHIYSPSNLQITAES